MNRLCSEGDVIRSPLFSKANINGALCQLGYRNGSDGQAPNHVPSRPYIVTFIKSGRLTGQAVDLTGQTVFVSPVSLDPNGGFRVIDSSLSFFFTQYPSDASCVPPTEIELIEHDPCGEDLQHTD